ncbi:MAG: PilT/PilU family type 4a pilus ATPase [Candidatus Eremiobacterota bacterium]
MRRRIGALSDHRIPLEEAAPAPAPATQEPVAFQPTKPQTEAKAPPAPAPPPKDLNGPVGELQRDLYLLTQRVDATASSRSVEELKAQVERLSDQVEAFEKLLVTGGLGGRVKKKRPEAPEADGDVVLPYSLSDLLRVMIKHGASDLHIKTGAAPTVRLHGELITIGNKDEKLTAEQCRKLVFSVLSPTHKRKLKKQKEVDFACLLDRARFRVHAFYERNHLTAAYRLLRTDLPSFEALGLPTVLRKIAGLNNGLVLVTGPAGQGKSTTLAAMVDFINKNRKVHVVTIEDPIEYFHEDNHAFITQREVGPDTHSFADGLRQALRQDPNVILVGEMRDLETITTAVSAAETGHLVLSTLHTPNTVQAVDRIVDAFPPDSQKQIRVLLSKCLRAVISQRLLVRKDGKGRVPAVEVLVSTPAISSYILEGRTEEIYPLIERGATEGMQTFAQAMLELFQKGLITKDEAMYHADQASDFRLAAEGHTTGTSADSMRSMNTWL